MSIYLLTEKCSRNMFKSVDLKLLSFQMERILTIRAYPASVHVSMIMHSVPVGFARVLRHSLGMLLYNSVVIFILVFFFSEDILQYEF